jgi:hypothetical protein
MPNPFEIDPFGFKARARKKIAINEALGYQAHKYKRTKWYRGLSEDEIKSKDQEYFTILAKEYPDDLRYKDYSVNNTGSPMKSAYKTPLQDRYYEYQLHTQTSLPMKSEFKDSLPDWQKDQLRKQENYAYGYPDYGGGRKKKPKSYRRKTRTSRRKPKTRRKKH